ncbi:ABC transporter permease [Paenibacillus sp. GSMTC-2017]|nr:ABC transporter permease [Paenibacillus sp. GSMTC-2017]MBH5319134.1 ABC transporter permease [Paenibacillus sp. GSMTC-2017]
MADFFNLIQNENMKIYRRPRTYIMMGIMVALALIVSIIWLSVANDKPSMWEVVQQESSLLFMLITIFTVIVAASIVAEEFSAGTIKLLLIRPWSRSKILLSKYIATVMFAILLAIVLLASTLLINWICFDLFSTADTTNDFRISEGSSNFGYIIQYYALSLVTTIMTVTIAFMISTIFRSNGLAIGISLFLVLIVNNILFLLGALPYKWVDYLLFVHLYLTPYLDNIPMREGSTLGFSLMVLAGYYILFMAITWWVFNKRDVAS